MKHCILLILEGSNWSDSKQDCSSNWCSNSWSGTDCDWQHSSIIQQNRKIFFLIFRFLRFRRELVALLKMRESLASILSVFKRRGVRLRKQWNFHSSVSITFSNALCLLYKRKTSMDSVCRTCWDWCLNYVFVWGDIYLTDTWPWY